MPNPDCPYCHKPMCFNGTKSSGARQYRCRRGCLTPEGKTVTMTDSDRKRGGQTIGDKPMSQSEYDLRYRLAHPDKYREVHKYKPKTKDKQLISALSKQRTGLKKLAAIPLFQKSK